MTSGSQATSSPISDDDRARMSLFVYIAITLSCVIAMIVGVIINNGMLFAVGLLLFLFFAIYIVYAYIKKKGL